MNALSPVATKSPYFTAAERRWSELKTARAQHERLWEEIARLMRPQRGGFSRDDASQRQLERPLSSAPIHAQGSFSAGLYGTLTNPASPWFGFETNDDGVNEWHTGKKWLDMVAARVMGSFAPSVSPFYNATSQVFSDVASFGNAAQYDELVASERKILDVTLSLSEVCYDIDGFGRVSEVVRRFLLTPTAAMSMFQMQGDMIPPKLAELAEKGDTARIVFYHHVIKNDAWRKGSLGVRGKAWVSRYTTELEGALIRLAGYAEMPFFAPRWDVETGSTYGVGPGFVALASARAHNRMDEATLRMAQRQADPTILAPNRADWPLEGRVVPGAVIYNGMDAKGNRRLAPLELAGGGFNLTLQEKQAKLEEIKDAYHYTLMQLAGRSGMTATEVLTIQEERQRLWAPHQGRLQEEYLAPKIARRFSLLWRAGQIPPPPPELENLELRVTYKSAAAAAQRSTEGNAALRIIQDLTPLMAIDPRYSERIDADGLLEVLMDARGAPARMIRSRAEADEIGRARAEQEQQAQAMQAAQAGAGIVKDLGGAMPPGMEGAAQ
jgi:hypothetical protein